ncbi:MAG TPA: sialidase family protein [Candidatus Bathyarchaeia archaeon]|nr:sialidase family protein [Candidatus Bathyarchaeia archaeon]
MRGIVIALLAYGVVMGAVMGDDIVVEKVFGKELPGQYKHPAAITELASGDLYLAYYGGSGEYHPDTAVYGARLKKGSTEWDTPVPIADTPFHSDGNPVVWQAPDGVVWLFHVVRYGDTWSDSRIHAKISRDEGTSWSDSFVLADERGMMVRSQPLLLDNGDYLLPIYHETGHDREEVGADTTGLFLRCDPKIMRWTETNRITARNGCLQPSVVQISPDYLIAYLRRGGGYGPCTDGYIVRAESHDGGHTWSAGTDSQFANPNAAIDFIKLRNGHLLLVYNDNMEDRTPLTVAISTDNDKTYPYKKNIQEGAGPFAYPYAIQTRDDKIHIIFTTDNRTQIMRAVFEERAITGTDAP